MPPQEGQPGVTNGAVGDTDTCTWLSLPVQSWGDAVPATPSMEHRASHLLPTAWHRPAPSPSKPWDFLRSWRSSPISKDCCSGKAHGASPGAAQHMEQRQEATLASLRSVLVHNKSSTRDKRGAMGCLSHGTQHGSCGDAGVEQEQGKLGAGSGKGPGAAGY